MTDASNSTALLANEIRKRLTDAGLGDAKLVSESAAPAPFGDATAIFGMGPLLLRFTRDRGQEFVDLASVEEPTVFHQFDDVEIAMGWRSIDDVLAKREPDSIGSVLSRIKANLSVLLQEFSAGQVRSSTARVQLAARARGDEYLARLRRNR